MNEDFINNEEIIELKTLIDKAEEIQADIDAYCDFMKQVFLSVSGIN